jgi:hypothetical protein
MAGAEAAGDPTPSQFRRKWGTDRHHLPTRHPKPGSSRVGGQTHRPRAPGCRLPGPARPKPHGQSQCQPKEGPGHEVGPARWPQTGGRQPPDAGGRRACAGPTGKMRPTLFLVIARNGWHSCLERGLERRGTRPCAPSSRAGSASGAHRPARPAPLAALGTPGGTHTPGGALRQWWPGGVVSLAGAWGSEASQLLVGRRDECTPKPPGQGQCQRSQAPGPAGATADL